MLFDFDAIEANGPYKLMAAVIVPRPIAWITTLGADGTVNAAPYSFFNALSGDPPVVGVGIGGLADGTPKDSRRNIEAKDQLGGGGFVVNLVPFAAAEAMNVTAIDFPHGTPELAEAGLTTLPSARVAPPRIAESPAALECEHMQSIDLGRGRAIVLGRVLAMHVRDDAVLDRERCHIDTPKLDLVGRMHGGGWYARTTDRFEVPRIALDAWQRRT